MLSDEPSNDAMWSPAGTPARAATDRQIALSMTPAEWAALSRLATGEWLSDAHISRLQDLGLVERVFGQALLTRLGRTTLGMSR